MDQRLEHVADHAEMVAVTFELTLEVDEIDGGGVEPLDKQAAQEERDFLRKLSASSNT